MVASSRLHPARAPATTLPGAAPIPTLAMPTFAVSSLQCTEHDAASHTVADVAADCRYQVAWAINPHMSIGSVEYGRAAVQHAIFIAALESAGATIHRLPFVHGAYDSVFVKDPALLLARGDRKRAVLANFAHPERRAERFARATTLAARGYQIVGETAGPTWEGGDVVMFPTGDGMFLGHGLRSERAAAAWLERHTELPVYPLELTTPELYHLDMALSILPDGTALVCPWALTPAALRTLSTAPAVRQVIPVHRALALEFGLNLVPVNDTVVIGTSESRITAIVASLGYRTIEVPLGEFHLAGGSAACLVATVHSEPVE